MIAFLSSFLHRRRLEEVPVQEEKLREMISQIVTAKE
jgi:hypothetical protein